MPSFTASPGRDHLFIYDVCVCVSFISGPETIVSFQDLKPRPPPQPLFVDDDDDDLDWMK